MLSISDEHLSNVEPVAKRLRGDANGGIPWMVILDNNGDSLATSDGPSGNIGYPFEPTEIEHFIDMLKRTSRRISSEEIAQLKSTLEEFSEAKRKEREAAKQNNPSSAPTP